MQYTLRTGAFGEGSKVAALLTLAASLLVGPAPAHAQSDTYELDGLVVTASPTPRDRSAVANNLSVLNIERLRADGMTTVEDALRGLPGVAVVRGGSFGAATSVFMRGGESDYVLVLVDGVQVNQPGGAFDFASLSLDLVERIEVLRGPSSALYGSDAVGGVIHIVTRSGGGDTAARVTSRVGAYDTRDWSADVAGGSGTAGYAFSVSRRHTDGILAFNNQHTRTTLSGRARLDAGERTRADFSFRLGDREYHFPTDGAGNVVDTNAFTYGDEVLVGARVRHELSSELSVDVRLGLVDTDGGSNDAQDGPADSLGFFGFTSLDHLRRSTAEIRVSGVWAGAVVTAGWEIEEERQRSFTESLSQYGNSAGRSEHGRLNRAYFTHVTGERGSVSFNAGARLDDNERFGTSGTWQLGATWSVTGAPGLRLRAAAGRALKEPTFFETFATGFAVGNPELEPETSTSWEAGADVAALDGRFLVRATWFDQRFRDLIQYTFTPPSPGGANYFNVAEATSRGLEAEARWRDGPLGAGLAWTLLDTEVVDSGFDEGAGAAFVNGEPLLRRPRHTLRADASVAVAERADLFAQVAVVGSRADRDFSTWPATPVVLERYTDVALGTTVHVLDGGATGFDLTLRVENVLDRDVREVFGFLAPGRALYVSGTLRLGGR